MIEMKNLKNRIRRGEVVIEKIVEECYILNICDLYEMIKGFKIIKLVV